MTESIGLKLPADEYELIRKLGTERDWSDAQTARWLIREGLAALGLSGGKDSATPSPPKPIKAGGSSR